jgi:hypothetical protein
MGGGGRFKDKLAAMLDLDNMAKKSATAIGIRGGTRSWSLKWPKNKGGRSANLRTSGLADLPQM